MPKGSNIKKGMRPGGRQKGTPNKRTTEMVERARVEVEQAKSAGVKLAKDVLQDYVGAFHNIAAVYQNRVAIAMKGGGEPAAADVAAFEKWGGLVVMTARALAEYQSPKFRAIMVTAPAPEPQPRTIDGNVTRINDPIAMARVYAQMVKRVG